MSNVWGKKNLSVTMLGLLRSVRSTESQPVGKIMKTLFPH
jgi:hypothetical protein